ncbi:TetR/AcrR family transcriptional regulator [Jejubacter calystegiae]|uniref:TetR/AcrR family transcriptional regulator n=1 Tax=Jejubacter calystegiae TaxID=2579935 RepID=A0A4P8YF49_9ENTR|nr:TetR/AcrR family transcriptional regulator [Jejubacter calystegiae]QCT18258.1 TetR/AcrR family transcriptional regulator [Jejubacter calystegiae]
MGQSQVKERGRPREFDTDSALDQAMLVFRNRGYHAATIGDLSTAMGLTSGSIYKAFKDKRNLFIQVFARYLSQRSAALQARLAPFASGRERIAEWLRFYLESAADLEGQRGCLVVGSTVESQALDEELAGLARQAVMRNRAFIGEMIREGQRDGSIAAGIDPALTADLLLCLTLGMRVMGKVTEIRDGNAAIAQIMKLLD